MALPVAGHSTQNQKHLAEKKKESSKHPLAFRLTESLDSLKYNKNLEIFTFYKNLKKINKLPTFEILHKT